MAGGFEARFAELAELLAPIFSRCDLRSNAQAYLCALLKPGVSGNCWALAQAVGHDRPYRLQHLLSGAVWDEDAVRDALRAFVARAPESAEIDRNVMQALKQTPQNGLRPPPAQPAAQEMTTTQDQGRLLDAANSSLTM